MIGTRLGGCFEPATRLTWCRPRVNSLEMRAARQSAREHVRSWRLATAVCSLWQFGRDHRLLRGLGRRYLAVIRLGG